MKDIFIIGGGASGLLAAILLKREVGSMANITILERLERTGKKLLATGNGRCNFTNTQTDEHKYNNPKFVKPLLHQFNQKQTIELFRDLGLLHLVDSEGRVYPITELSSSVLDCLRNEAKRLEVQEKCNSEVKRILQKDTKFTIETIRGNRYDADFVIMATGGKSNPILGSNGSGYSLLKQFKVNCTDCLPGLVGLKVDPNQVRGLDGIRAKGKIRIFNKKSKALDWEDEGEIQFKNDGINGIVVMQAASHLARNSLAKSPLPLNVVLDLLPDYSEEDIVKLLEPRLCRLGDFPSETILTGIFPRLLGMMIIKRAKLDLSGYAKDLTVKDLAKIAAVMKCYEFDIKDTYSFERSQVTVGGISCSEVLPETLELRKVTGMYLCGELIDIDGLCGGYNLQWAWTSAFIVSKALAQRIRIS